MLRLQQPHDRQTDEFRFAHPGFAGAVRELSRHLVIK